MIVKILLAIAISIVATTFMSMFLAGCTSSTDKEYEDVEQLKYIEEWNKRRKMTTKEEALNVLIAHACCTLPSNCDKCPWNGTKDCESTKFSEVLDETINVITEGK